MENRLDIYRESNIIASIDIDQSTVYSEKLPGTRLITCPIATQEILDLKEEDYTIFDEEILSINLIPDFEKDGADLDIKYNITFEAAFYKLLDKYVKNSLGKRTFSLYGSAADHLALIIASAGEGWTVESVDDTEDFYIDYADTYIRPALDIIAEKSGLEWNSKNKMIKMVKTIGRDTGLVFQVGRGKGLHQIKRSPDASKNVVTRAYGKGGTKNITSAYRNGIEPNLIFEGEYVETIGVTNGTERIKEATYTNENIYPHYKGVVGSVSILRGVANKIVSVAISDPAINFDLNAQFALTPSQLKPKVSFLTGELSGLDFEIEKYMHSTRTVTLIPATDTNGNTTPNDLNLPAIADKWTLIDLVMPSGYYETTELELKNETQKFLDETRFQNLIYNGIPSEKQLRDNQTRLRAGDNARVVETDFGVDEILRFTEISFPVVNRYNVTFVLSNKVVYNKVVKLFADVLNVTKQVDVVNRKSEELAKRGVQELRIFEKNVFDTDGKMKEQYYSATVLKSLLLIIGTESQDFRLSGVFITDNYNMDANAVHISGGELIHREISNPGNQNIWQMQQTDRSGLVPDKLYWVYCKCSKITQVGSYVITVDQIKFDQTEGFWMFLAGVIYPVIDGYRNSEFTNGIADINPNRIKIGKLVSRDGLTGFDLDNNTIFGDILFRSGTGALKPISQLQKDFDAGLNQALADSSTKANDAETNAKNFAIAQDSQLKALTDAYADGKITAEEQARINQAAANLQTARNEIETARLYGVEYANAQIAISKTQTLSAASSNAQAVSNQARIDAINSSNTYATTEAAAQRVIAEAYADGKVTSEEQARIDQALKNLEIAKADATAKANAAAVFGQAAQAAYNNLTTSLRTLAYQDVEDMAISGVSVFKGGKLNVVLLDALFIRSNIINAGYINTLAIDAGSIQTGVLAAERIDVSNLIAKNLKTAGDKHVEINGVDNNVRVVSANGEVLIEVDDDSALEGFRASTGERLMGPGIRVGALGGLSGSFGRKSVVLTDNAGLEQNFIGQDLNGISRVSLDSTGGFTLKFGSDSDVKIVKAGTTYKGITGRFQAALPGSPILYYDTYVNGFLVATTRPTG